VIRSWHSEVSLVGKVLGSENTNTRIRHELMHKIQVLLLLIRSARMPRSFFESFCGAREILESPCRLIEVFGKEAFRG
jgi:hypothetical protein